MSLTILPRRSTRSRASRAALQALLYYKWRKMARVLEKFVLQKSAYRRPERRGAPDVTLFLKL